MGNLAIFYRDFSYAAGLVRLGKLDSGVEALKEHGTLTVTIEKVDG
ncbi:cyclophilin-like fold protein [Burkholderia pyrrocinia]|nr:cyclophilin-like fold protein [Burkholderia pyrrocinia]